MMARIPKASANLKKENHAGVKRKAVRSKWLCCFMQSAEAVKDLSKTFSGVHTSRDAYKKSLPSTVYSGELAHLEAEDNTYECGCCFSEEPFENLVQCTDGHLFCFTCVKRRVEESTFGVLPASGPLACMFMGGCEHFIPWSEIQRSVENGLLSKFEQRQAADAVAQAQIPGIANCPACDLACVLDPNVEVFRCPSEHCGKATCMKCKEPFHEGTCKEEKPSETQARKDVEEIMSKCRIRECVACKAKIIKESGCNKINCRCGAMMCYTCRQPIKGYDHFCKHSSTNGEKCKKCRRCTMHYKEDSAAKVKAAMKVAVENKAKENPKIVNVQSGPIKVLPTEQSNAAIRWQKSCFVWNLVS